MIVARREGHVLAFVDLRLIQEAQLDRIHVEPDGQLIHSRLEGEQARHSAGPTHGGRGADIAANQARGSAKIRCAVAVAGGLTATLGVVVED